MKLDKRHKTFITDTELKNYINTHQHLTYEHIAKNLGISKAWLLVKVKNIGISKTPCKKYSVKEEDIKDFLEKNPNSSGAEIARHFKVNPTTITTKLNKMGFNLVRAKINNNNT